MNSLPITPTERPRTRVNRVRKFIALVGVTLMSALVGPVGANAVEFDPIPAITGVTQCRPATADAPGGMVVSMLYENLGAGTATFHEVIQQNALTLNNDILVTDTPAAPKFLLLEGTVSSLTVTSTDGPGATYSVSFDPVDCEPHPTASIEVVCSPTRGEDPTVRYTYQNASLNPVTLTFAVVGGPSSQTTASGMASPAVEIQSVPDKSLVHATVEAGGVVLADLVTAPQCNPFTLTVSNKVVGGTANPAFDFQVVCTPNAQNLPDYVLASFVLHDGESHVVDFPFDEYCSARELAPGSQWTVMESVNGNGYEVPDSSTLQPSHDQTAAFLNTAVAPPPIDSSTIPTSIPSTLGSTIPPMTTVPAAGLTPSAVSTTTIPTPLATELPVTGTSNLVLALIGLVLLGTGSALVVAARRSAACRTTSVATHPGR